MTHPPPSSFSERILDFMERSDYRPMKVRRLARAMCIGQDEMGDFHDAVDALRRMGRVVQGTRNALMLPHSAGLVSGTYRGNPGGFGFVVPDDPGTHGDLYIAEKNKGDAVTGDRVLCSVVKRGKRQGKMLVGGRVERILERGESRFVGELLEEDGIWYVKPDGNTLHVPIFIGDPGAKSARAGDQVVVEITQYPQEDQSARGVIVERLGEKGKPGVDLVSVLRQFHIPDEFPEEVLEEARACVRRFDADRVAAEREDLSDRLIITIDPDEARDFDDAISLTAEPDGGWELGVHIADVSTFVLPGTAMDEEASERGTSVYLPGHVVPMLPEVLSNGLCSLQEGEPRLTKSVFIRYDHEAHVRGARFANTLIRSTQRLTYRQVTAVLDELPGRPSLPAPVVDLLQRSETLALAIQRRRLDRGMIVLDLPAVDLILDPDGRVLDAEPEDTSFSHTIIEMFMVEANEAVARLMSGLGVPILRRIHPPPDEDELLAMGRFLRIAGVPMSKQIGPRNLQKMLDRLRGQPQSYAVNLAVLKSMRMAEYAPDEVGHFALASEHYAHFTSPIRRYPDLMLHRRLQQYLDGVFGRGRKSRRRSEDRSADLEPLQEQGRRMSYLSRRAENAERELVNLKVLTLLAEQIGDTFDGVVTGIAGFGLFVQHPKYLVEGLLRIEDLGDDWFEIDDRKAQIVGERTRARFRLGTEVNVRIVSVDLGTRQLDLSLVSAEGARGRRERRARPPKTPNRPAGRSTPRSRRGPPVRKKTARRKRGR